MKRIFHWIPRILSIGLAVWWLFFIYLAHRFSLLSIYEWLFWAALLAAALISWKLEFLGGSLYLFLGLFYFIIGMGRVSALMFFIIPFPLIFAGLLFLISGWSKGKAGLKKIRGLS